MAPNSSSIDPSQYPEETFDLYSIPAFDKGWPEISRGCEIGSSKQVVQPNDVLISRIVPHIRRSWVVSEQRARRQIASGEWIVFRSPKIYPVYLRYLLVADHFHGKFMRTIAGVGGSLLRARPAQVADIEIALPSLSEQRSIAARLEQADRLRRMRRFALELSESLLGAVFLEMFGDIVRNAKRWPRLPLLDTCENITDGTHDTPDRVKSGIPFITSKNIRPFEVDLTALDFVSLETHREITKRCNPRYGDILYTNIGVNVGNAVANRLRFEFSLKNVALIQPDFARLDSSFLEALMNDARFKEHVLRVSSVGGAQKFVSLELLRGIEIVLPPIQIQQQFGALVERMQRLRAGHREALRQAEHLFQTLLHRAFGEGAA